VTQVFRSVGGPFTLASGADIVITYTFDNRDVGPCYATPVLVNEWQNASGQQVGALGQGTFLINQGLPGTYSGLGTGYTVWIRNGGPWTVTFQLNIAILE
jgi:hypothetical protein